MSPAAPAGGRTARAATFAAARAPVDCLYCGTAIPASVQACPACGEPVVEGERKLVTVLFADLAGYTSLASALDPEDVYSFIRPAMTELRLIVERFGGTVPQIMGDGFMAVFGVPTAHEDDAERGVRAGLEMQEKAAELRGRRGRRLPPVRVGISTGEVLVAGSREPSGFTVVGDTVNVAARLESICPGGGILVSGRTRELTRHAIRYGARRPRRLKGKREPLATFEARRALTAIPEGHVAPFRSTALVGRREVLARLGAELERTIRTQRSRALLVTGEAGLGKTRLAAEFRSMVAGTSVLAGRCPPYGERLPLAPLPEAVRELAGVDAKTSPHAAAGAASRLAERLAPGSRSTFLAGQIGFLIGLESAVAGMRPGGSGQEGRIAARGVLESLATARPLLVILDDVQWGDAELLQLIREAHEEPWRRPVFFLCLARPERAGREPSLPHVELSALGRDEVRSMIEQTLGPEVPEMVIERLRARSGGNPLFVEESARMLVETGVLTATPHGWELTDRGAVEEVPSTLRLLVAARIDGLAPEEKRVLQAAAVAGETTWDRLVAHLTGHPGSRAILRRLERRDLIRRMPRILVPGAAEYAFKHVVIRDVAYQSLPRRDRARRHLQVADWLREATRDAPAEPVATIAQQYEQAWTLWREPSGSDRGPPRDLASTAADYLARWADEVFAYRPRFAASLFERSLAILRAGPARSDQAALARLLTGRAESLIVLGRQRDAVADAEEAERLARRARDPRSRARALLALGQARSFLGEVEVARTLLEQARRLFQQDGDLRGQAHALERLAVAARLHDFDLQVDLYRRAHALFEEAGDRHGIAAVSQVLAYLLTWIGGREFEDRFAEARRIADEQGDTRSRASLARTYGYACWYRGNYDEAIAAAREAGPDAALAGDRWVEVDALLLEAMATSVAGNAEDGERLSKTLRGIAERAEAPRLKALALLVGVRPALRAGRPGLARRRLTSAAKLLDRIGAASNERIEVCLVEAGFHLDRGDWPSVGGPAGEAERHAAEHGWRLYEPHGPLLFGRALLGAGRLREATRELRRAASLARAAGTTGILASAQAAGAQARILSGASARPVRRGDHGPLVGAVDDENRGLLALRDGAAREAAARFASAAAAWQTLGLTEWLARAHAFRADALRRGRSWRAARDAEDLARSIRESLRPSR